MVIRPDNKTILKTALCCLVVSIIVTIGYYGASRAAEEARSGVLAVGAVSLAFVWVLGFPLWLLSFYCISYHVEDAGLVFRSGLIKKTVQNIPYAKITDFKLERSLLDRLLGLATIYVQTAGQSSASYEGRMIGLTGWDDTLKILNEHIQRPSSADDGGRAAASAQLSPNGTLDAMLAELREIRKLLERDR